MSAQNLFGTENELGALAADLETAETTEDGIFGVDDTIVLSVIVCPSLIGLSIAYSC